MDDWIVHMDGNTEIEPTHSEAIRVMAAGDVEAVGKFFRAIGRLAPPIHTICLPPETLLGIGLALRLASWELNGINLHVAAGLPSACEFKAFICRYISGPEPQVAVSALSSCIWVIFHDEFSWQAMTDM